MNNNFPHSWQQIALESCMEAIIDYRGKTPQKTSFGIPLITAKIVKGGRINDIEEYIAVKDYDSWMRRGIPKLGDIVMTTEAPLGEVAQLDNAKVALAQRLITLRGDSKLLDNNYLKFLMQSAFVQNQLHARATGTTVLGIKQSELRKIYLIVPPLNEQKAIAQILSSLDDKIELNQQMNETLEAMARAMFKSWFVNFDPVRAKMEGRQPAGMDAATADLFPDEFEESSLGLIPKGWRVGTIETECKLVMGQSPKSEFYNTTGDGLPFHQGVTNFGARFPTHKNFCTVCERIANKGDILFSVRAPVGRINIADKQLIIGRGLAAIRHNQDYQSFLLYHLAHTFKEEDSIGTGTIFASVTRKDLQEVKLIIPTDLIIKFFDAQIQVLDNRISHNGQESRTLTAIRDSLLPKLISGQIRVNEAEKTIEKVA
ncbi:restriction endonuclease subunit S [Cylindrospermum sp. FACHB-282]|uniref:restriction endonuclease subunit S n=1 Tax=Cylindrospermum sp. FACHB-282 TaxID=2692794 RepID=UPI00168A1039|nr:restriction endonuclease subunit S [Cylindrospermum sp. FACHB-282]MBD2387824.1 restriction endonuclease subunit S [Cylindrospermum sp. FACHB-282]